MSRKFDLVLIGTQETFSLKNLQLLSCFLLIYFCLIRFPCAHPNVILTSILDHVFLPNQTPGMWAWVPLVSVWVWQRSTASWLSLWSLLSLLHQIAFSHEGYGALSPTPAWMMSHPHLFLLSNNCYQSGKCVLRFFKIRICIWFHQALLQKSSLGLSF